MREPGLLPALQPACVDSVFDGGRASARRTLRDVLEATVAAVPLAPALDDGRRVLSYRDLLAEVDRLAAQLREQRIAPGDRVGVRVPSGTADLYLAILGVLSTGAAYVPVDVDDPDERAELVLSEAGAGAVIGAAAAVTPRSVARQRPHGPRRPVPDDDAWIIFTSGSTGRPKGVAVTHGAASAFVDAEAALFCRDRPLGPGDRVLAGLSVAFDASCEEMWLAWRHGACLVPAPRSLVRAGADLGEWLVAQRITVVSTVPTLAALWPAQQLRGIRLLILGGEACPAELADRLCAQCPEVWNTYGPTETTVVATAARLRRGDPVRIGLPLRGWRLAVVNPSTGCPVGMGQVGELVISGVGTARYLDPAQDAAKFGPLPALGWDRAYRSGDLVRAEARGLSFVGRADGQVKIRGCRIELSEIESVLLALPGVAQAVVTTDEPAPGAVELVGYYTTVGGALVEPDALRAGLRGRLPAHMVPAYLEELAAVPMTTSGKVDRKALPPPRRGRSSERHVAPTTRTETVLAGLLAQTLGVARVSVDAHLFDDLGANSLTLAHFCARVRSSGLPPVAIQDVYQHPTVRRLAAPRSTEPIAHEPPQPDTPRRLPAGRARYAAFAGAQLLLLTCPLVITATVAHVSLTWLITVVAPVALYLRCAAVVTGSVLALTLLPVAAKWTLIGRWRADEIPLWSAAHLRLWTVKTLVRTSPMAMFAGSPLYLVYLRALGARIGRGVTVFSTTVPVCTDLLTIGDRTVVRRGAAFSGYRAEPGVLRTGRVTIGANVVVGEDTVLDLDTELGDGAQLGHASSLHAGQAVPAGQRWHGCPARRTDVDFSAVAPARCGTGRRAAFAAVQLVNLLVLAPAGAAAVVFGVQRLPALVDLIGPAGLTAPGGFYLTQLVLSAGLFIGGLLGGLAFVVAVPRLVHRMLERGRVHPLYGLRYWALRFVARTTNAPYFMALFGDSSYVVCYLRAIGYRVPATGQTGSNFGASLAHVTPYLCGVGGGTMVSDGVTLSSAAFSSTSFRTAPVSIGTDSFLGNAITYPVGGRVGDNCLIGTKTMVPTDGPVRHDVGLLGSPAFEIPRSAKHESRSALSRRQFKDRLGAKNRYNLRTMGLFLLIGWFRFHVTALVGCVAVDLDPDFGPVAILAGLVLAAAFNLGWTVLVERAATGFRPLSPRVCSIYEPYFWWHERYWKLSSQLAIFNGTPFKGPVWRMLGVRVGRQLFDDGCGITEKTLVRIGDDCVLNAGVVLQAHSMEDGVFKSDEIRLGNRVAVGPAGFLHYDVTVGDDASIGPDSFVMKGSFVAPCIRWLGNPARELAGAVPRREHSVALAATRETRRRHPDEHQRPHPHRRAIQPGQRRQPHPIIRAADVAAHHHRGVGLTTTAQQQFAAPSELLGTGRRARVGDHSGQIGASGGGQPIRDDVARLEAVGR